MSEKKKFDYQRYLASREWAQRKEAIMERSGGFCERCLWGSYESTHHLTYAHIGNEPLEDLLAVCNACHEYLSAKSDYDPRQNLMFWIIAGPRREVDGFWDGCRGHLIGAVHRDTQKPVWALDVTAFFNPSLDESVGLSAGLLSV